MSKKGEKREKKGRKKGEKREKKGRKKREKIWSFNKCKERNQKYKTMLFMQLAYWHLACKSETVTSKIVNIANREIIDLGNKY